MPSLMNLSLIYFILPFLANEPTVKYAESMKNKDMKKLWLIPVNSERRIGEIPSDAPCLNRRSPAPPYAIAVW
jgi:hypothetical protein